MSRTFKSASSASRRTTSDLTSCAASARMSASPDAASSSECVRSVMTVLYSRKRSTSGSISEAAFASFLNSDGSLWSWAVPAGWELVIRYDRANLSNIKTLR